MKIGFIGCGNMAGAMIGGIIASGKCKNEELMAADLSETMRKTKEESLGIHVTADNKEVAAFADILFLSVKPQFYEAVITEIRNVVTDTQVIVTIAPGKTLSWLGETFGKDLKIIRTMPNTPAMVMEGMMGMCPNAQVTNEELAMVRDICSGFSKTEVISEHLMDVVTAVSGSSPAYVFMFIEAMADAAVLAGMPRNQAYEFAAQSVLGSAKMVLETGKHPAELKDMVCSPAGTTIEAVKVLEEKGFRAAVMDAVEACVNKSKNM